MGNDAGIAARDKLSLKMVKQIQDGDQVYPHDREEMEEVAELTANFLANANLFALYAMGIVNVLLDSYVDYATTRTSLAARNEDFTKIKIDLKDELERKIEGEVAKQTQSHGSEIYSVIVDSIEAFLTERLPVVKQEAGETSTGHLESDFLPRLTKAIEIAWRVFSLYKIQNLTKEDIHGMDPTVCVHYENVYESVRRHLSSLMLDYSNNRLKMADSLTSELENRIKTQMLAVAGDSSGDPFASSNLSLVKTTFNMVNLLMLDLRTAQRQAAVAGIASTLGTGSKKAIATASSMTSHAIGTLVSAVRTFTNMMLNKVTMGQDAELPMRQAHMYAAHQIAVAAPSAALATAGNRDSSSNAIMQADGWVLSEHDDKDNDDNDDANSTAPPVRRTSITMAPVVGGTRSPSPQPITQPPTPEGSRPSSRNSNS